MTCPDWKTALTASAISAAITFGLGFLYIWAVL